MSAWLLSMSVIAALCLSSLIAVVDGTEVQYIRLGQTALYSVTIWAVLLAAARRVWLVLVMAFPAAIFLPLEVWMRLEIGSLTTSNVVALIAETSPAEVANFFASYGGTIALWWVLWVALYGAAAWSAFRRALTLHNRSRLWLLAIFPSMVLTQYVLEGAPQWIDESVSASTVEWQQLSGWSEEWEDVYPLNWVVAVQRYRVESVRLETAQMALHAKPLGATMSRPEEAPEVVVLVIGESAAAERWSLFGYRRETTPRLSAEAGLLAFSDVAALSGSTRSAVPGVLSRRPIVRPDGKVDVHAESSLIKAFAEVGYQTHWYSNQAPFGQFDSSIAIYAREADDVRFMNPSTFSLRSSLDEILLKPLKEVLKTPGRHLVVLHTMGSHFNYAWRYPDSFDRFKPSLKIPDNGGDALVDGFERISNSYDNTVLYADHVLSEVIDIVKVRSARSLVAYFSDHGVDLPDNNCPYTGDARSRESTYRVPVLFWFGEGLRKIQTESWTRMRENRSDAYTTQAVYPTLLELARIKLPGETSLPSFLQHSDIRRYPRMVGIGSAMVDFDETSKRFACRLFPKDTRVQSARAPPP